MRGKGIQVGNTVTVFPTWIPFPSLRSAGDDNGENAQTQTQPGNRHNPHGHLRPPDSVVRVTYPPSGT
jgi:hypothetical protein